MNQYIKKPIPVSALQWTGDNLDEIKEFCNEKEIPFSITKNYDLSIGDKKIGEYQLGDAIYKVNFNNYIVITEKEEIKVLSDKFFEHNYQELIFEESNEVESNEVEFHEFAHKKIPVKSLQNTDSNGAKKNVKDIQFWGNGDTFKLISKASSESEGWMKSTKAMQIDGLGCVVQTTTQQRNPDGSYALTDAITFVPQSYIFETKDDDGNVIERKLKL